MSAIDLGKIMITHGGDWSPQGSYEILTVVRHNGASYLSISDNTGVEPGTDPYVWKLVAQDGDSSVLTIDSAGNIYKNGVLFSTILADAMSLIARASEAEDARVEAESARANAEQERSIAFGQKIAACENAAQAARDAAASVPPTGGYVKPSDIVFSTDIEADKLEEDKFVSPKAVYDFVITTVLSRI